MGYQGNAYPIDFSQGGLTGNRNHDAVQSYMMVWPSRNINLHRSVREKRGGTTHVYGAALNGAPQVMGLYDFRLLDGTRYIVSATGDGKLYKDDTSTIKTGMSTSNFFNFATGENKLFIVDGSTQMQVWTGTGSAADVAHPAADWTSAPPFQVVLHRRGNSQRMCAINSTNLYISKSYTAAGDMEDFSETGSTDFPIQTGDGWGLIGQIENNNELWLFGKTSTFRLLDTDSTIANWGITPSLFTGGAATWRLICRTPNNDIIAMMEDGEIYSINAVQEYGDYKRASITYPSRMDAWIKEHVNLAYIDLFHMVYDPYIRALRIFVVSEGQTTIDTCLIYFIDRAVDQAWMVHDNISYDSGFKASASALVRKSVGVNKVYTGDYTGNLWELETANQNDNGNACTASFRSPNFAPENLRMNKFFKSLRPIVKPKGAYDLQAQFWIDGKQIGSGSVSMSGGSSIVGTAIVGTATVSIGEILDESIEIGEKGVRFQFELWNSGVDQTFELSGAVIDAKPLAAKV
jgi:hypothetical protein